MNNRKTKLKLTDFECNLLWGGMNEFRNKACSDGIPTEDVGGGFQNSSTDLNGKRCCCVRLY